jgi:two-component sensor histidine kinase
VNDSTTVLARVQPVCRTFQGHPTQIPLVRDFVRRHLIDDHACPEDALHDILLCVSEIATNAILHTPSGSGGHFTVALRVRGGAVRVEVIDNGAHYASNGSGEYLADLDIGNASTPVERSGSSRSADGAREHPRNASGAEREPVTRNYLLHCDDSETPLPQGGLGLRLVSAYSDRMGFDVTARSGIAWFERAWAISL